MTYSYEATLKKAAERNRKILKMADDGMSYAEIAEKIKPRITRQRIGKIVSTLRARQGK